jgi:hypothetical protein
MDNLPPDDLKEIEDQVKAAVDYWWPRKKLVALGYLYKVCDVRIDDIPHAIRKALKAELIEKQKGTIAK